MFLAKLWLCADGKPVKKPGITAVSEKVFQHVHVKRFAEPSGAREQVYTPPALQKIFYQGCFIDIVKTVPADIFKTLHADGQFSRCVHSSSFLGYRLSL